MGSVDAARAVYGQGLQGDRYATAEGTFSRAGAAGHEVMLIETQALEALEREYDVALGPGDSRRNVVTRGIALNPLVGRVFTIGEVTLRGVRLCEPADILRP